MAVGHLRNILKEEVALRLARLLITFATVKAVYKPYILPTYIVHLLSGDFTKSHGMKGIHIVLELQSTLGYLRRGSVKHVLEKARRLIKPSYSKLV